MYFETHLCLACILWKFGIPFLFLVKPIRLSIFQIMPWSCLKVRCNDKSKDANKGEAREKRLRDNIRNIRGYWLKVHLLGYLCFKFLFPRFLVESLWTKHSFSPLSPRVFVWNQIKILIYLLGSFSGLNAIIFVKHLASSSVYLKAPNVVIILVLMPLAMMLTKGRVSYESFCVYGLFVN